MSFIYHLCVLAGCAYILFLPQGLKPSLYTEWLLTSLDTQDREKICFSEYVNFATVLAMFESMEAKRFLFGMMDSEKSGALHIDKFLTAARVLSEQDSTVSVKKLKRLFESYCDDYQTVSFEQVN